MSCDTDGKQIRVVDNDASAKTLTIYTDDLPAVVNVYEDVIPRIVRVVSAGAPGAPGQRGPAGPTGSHPPFFLIEGTTRYATTSSISFQADISSSLLPVIGKSVYGLGSVSKPWGSIYSTGSIIIIKNGSNNISIDHSGITVGNKKVITRVATNQQQFLIASASITGSSVNNQGVFSIGNFHYTPNPVIGGIILSGSKFYFGI